MAERHRLGELLVSAGACDPSHVRDAVDGQVVYGGRLGTNLLEMGAVTEADLAAALARRFGVKALHGEIAIDRRLLQLIRHDLADRFEVLPYEAAGRRLRILCADPSDLAKLDELAFATGMQIEPIVVPEARLWDLLRLHYGLGRPARGLRVDPARRRAPIALRQEAGPDLMDEADFAALYLPGARAGAPAVRRGPPAPGDPRTGVPPPWPAEPADPFAGSLVSSEEVLEGLQAEARAARPMAQEVISLGASATPAPAPLSFGEAAAALTGVADRAAIARVVLRYARSRFRRAVLLTVHARSADGWDGIGEGLTPQAVARVHVPLEGPGVIRTVVESRSHFLGPLVRTEANVRLLRSLGGGAPKGAFAMPILARGKVVNVLYADGGRGGAVNPDAVGELLILASKIGQSYDLLLQRAR